MFTNGPVGNGPSISAQVVTFTRNQNNPSDNVGTAMTNPLTVTYSLTNQQFTSIEGIPSSPGSMFGSGSNTASNTAFQPQPLFPAMNAAGGPVNSYFSATPTGTASTGIDVTANHSVLVYNCSDALIDNSGVNLYPFNSRIQYSDLVITFSRPVNNPVLQIAGLGGTFQNSSGGVYATVGYSTEFDLVTPGLTLTRLSGSQYFTIPNPTEITNSATLLGATIAGSAGAGDGYITRYAAAGSVVVNGTNITTLTLRMYLRGDGGIFTDGSGNIVAPGTSSLVWAKTTAISGDVLTLGVSLSAPVNLTGNVFHDPDGGNVNNSTGSANTIPAGIHVNLIDNNNKVAATATVNTDGTYNFTEVYPGNYQVQINTTQGAVGNTPPTVALPGNWVNTGSFVGTPNTGNNGNPNGMSDVFTVNTTDISNINFGIEQAPNTNNAGQTVSQPKNGTIAVSTITTQVSGSDPEQGALTGTSPNSGINITSLPTNGSLVYNSHTLTGTDVTNNGYYITNFDPTKLSFTGLNTGSINTSFNYAMVDQAGIADPTPATYTLNWITPLAVKLIQFNAEQKGTDILLQWESATEQDLSYYNVEHSTDGNNFTKLGTITAKGNSTVTTNYQFTHAQPTTGNHYYRLQMVNTDGSSDISPVKIVRISTVQQDGKIYVAPNPVNNMLHVTGVTDGDVITIGDMSGRMLYRVNATGETAEVNCTNLQDGIYWIVIKDNQGTVKYNSEIVKR
ncbi:SdrD B-like domain-containing protein [Taibaiella soli]|uniref:Secretion system C-terminal sorting domain-containing protein n=1 Tax=Taibaiella soli TaxID=1649169 RepID=A0A2W2B0C1_9BACT|nr:SdrD B-like domain-containing protein [Taibaiella soli]PZF73418.1 hypothetical protein DN068_08490 [Taibaiella soli]